MSTKTTELKVALPTDFSEEYSDAVRWIKAMKAYFSINASIYTSDIDKVMTTLNKMSKGCGVSFSEMWYDKMADTSIADSEKTFDKFASNFKSIFFPYDTKATTRFELTKLAQKLFKCPDSIMVDGVQKYITNFQNLASKAGISNDITLIDQFSLGLDQQLATMIHTLYVFDPHHRCKMDRTSQGISHPENVNPRFKRWMTPHCTFPQNHSQP